MTTRQFAWSCLHLQHRVGSAVHFFFAFEILQNLLVGRSLGCHYRHQDLLSWTDPGSFSLLVIRLQYYPADECLTSNANAQDYSAKYLRHVADPHHLLGPLN